MAEDKLSTRERTQIIATIGLGVAAILGILTLVILAQPERSASLLRGLATLSLVGCGVAVAYLGARATARKLGER